MRATISIGNILITCSEVSTSRAEFNGSYHLITFKSLHPRAEKGDERQEIEVATEKETVAKIAELMNGVRLRV